MALDHRFKAPQASTPESLRLWAEELIKTLRRSGQEPFLDQLNQNFQAAMDAAFGSAQGSIVYRGASEWDALAPGTAGNRLQTNGAGANPTWTPLPPAPAWQLAGTGPSGTGLWNHSSNIQFADFTNLAGFSDIFVIMVGVTCSAAAIRLARVSTDNGASYLAAASDYAQIAYTSAEGTQSHIVLSSGATAARGGWTQISAFNVSGAPKFAICPGEIHSGTRINTTTALNAIRVGVSSGTMNAGSIYILGKPT